MALVLAGLVARGRTWIEQTHGLDCGYEALDRKPARLGAVIERAEAARTACIPGGDAVH